MKLNQTSRRLRWRRHLPFLLILGLAAICIALPVRWTRAFQSGCQVMLAPGQSFVRASIAGTQRELELAWSTFATADTLSKEKAEIARLRTELEKTAAERDLSQITIARLRHEQATAKPLTSGSTLLTCEIVSAQILSQQARGVFAQHALLDVGSVSGCHEESLVLAGEPLLDHGAKSAVETGQILVQGGSVCGKIAKVGRWTSSIQRTTDASFRDVVWIVPQENSTNGQGTIRGLLEGQNQPLLRVRHVSITEAIAVGDWVISACSDNFGCGPLYYGRVARVKQIAGGLDWEIWVEPNIKSTAALSSVCVLCPRPNVGQLAKLPEAEGSSP